MIKCRTQIDKPTIKALAKYHMSRQKMSNRKRIFLTCLGAFLLIISLINAYGIWMKYHETESILIILLKSSVLFLMSCMILVSNLKSTEQNLYRELKSYFKKTGTKYIDYMIFDHGIQMQSLDKVTMYEWDKIDHVESDLNYIYFSCDDKHSIISKRPLTIENLNRIDKLLKNVKSF